MSKLLLKPSTTPKGTSASSTNADWVVLDEKKGATGTRTVALAGKRGPGRNRKIPASVPPSRDQTTMMRIRRLYVATGSATNLTVTAAEFLGALGTVGTVTNSTVVTMCSSFRIRKITMWPPSETTGANASAALFWTASSGNQFIRDSQPVTAVPDGMTVPQVVVARPPKKALCADWITPAAASLNLFIFTLSSGGVLEIDCDATLSNAQANVAITGFTTVVLGQVYYLALDGRSTNVVRPVDMVTTS